MLSPPSWIHHKGDLSDSACSLQIVLCRHWHYTVTEAKHDSQYLEIYLTDIDLFPLLWQPSYLHWTLHDSCVYCSSDLDCADATTVTIIFTADSYPSLSLTFSPSPPHPPLNLTPLSLSPSDAVRQAPGRPLPRAHPEGLFAIPPGHQTRELQGREGDLSARDYAILSVCLSVCVCLSFYLSVYLCVSVCALSRGLCVYVCVVSDGVCVDVFVFLTSPLPLFSLSHTLTMCRFSSSVSYST